MTYHPQGGNSSAKWFGDDDWLDFNMLQSGHDRFDRPNYEPVSKDYNRKPVKPCLDGEPRYEDHPVNWDPKNGWFNDFDVRQAAYWSLFAGAFGHTYGCHDIWQMYAPGRQPISSARNNWYDMLELPGAWDMMHVRNLIESRPFLSRVPDQSLIAGNAGSGPEHIRATRAKIMPTFICPMAKRSEWSSERLPVRTSGPGGSILAQARLNPPARLEIKEHVNLIRPARPKGVTIGYWCLMTQIKITRRQAENTEQTIFFNDIYSLMKECLHDRN